MTYCNRIIQARPASRRHSNRLLLTLLCGIGCSHLQPKSAHALDNSFQMTILVANRAEYNPTAFVDPHMENAWGLALRPPGAGGHIWISNARNASTSLYIGDANGVPLYQDGLRILYMDGPLYSYEGGLPQITGQVYNAASDIPGQPIEFFLSGAASNYTSGTAVPAGITSGPAKFVFVTKDGTINAWRANTGTSMDTAVIVKDYSDHGADQPPEGSRPPFLPAYTGVAMTTAAFTLDGSGHPVADNHLYVTDFQNKTIQVFNNQWQDITAGVAFERPAGMPENFSPFNIQSINDRLFVAYAGVDQGSEEPAFDIPEDGGHVVEYDRNGHLIREFNDAGLLTSPWGLALAPDGFGNLGGSLLVANFGDGTIAGFNPDSGAFVDFLRDPLGDPLSVDGIWGLAFGNGVSLGDANALYFTAGPNLEQDGWFGCIRMSTPAGAAVPEPASLSLLLLAAAPLLARRRRHSFRGR